MLELVKLRVYRWPWSLDSLCVFDYAILIYGWNLKGPTHLALDKSSCCLLCYIWLNAPMEQTQISKTYLLLYTYHICKIVFILYDAHKSIHMVLPPPIFQQQIFTLLVTYFCNWSFLSSMFFFYFHLFYYLNIESFVIE